MELDENGNPIPQEGEDNEEEDYKSLYEQEREKREKAEGRFKKTAKELNEIKASKEQVNPDELFEKKFNEKMFFVNNPVAREFEKEINELKKNTNLSTEDSYQLFIAKNKPELIGKSVNTGVDGVSKSIEPPKSAKEMTYEELRPNQKQR